MSSRKRVFQDPSVIDKSARQKLFDEVDKNAFDEKYLKSKRSALTRLENFIRSEYPTVVDDNNKVKVALLTVDIFKDFVGGLSRLSRLSRPSRVEGTFPFPPPHLPTSSFHHPKSSQKGMSVEKAPREECHFKAHHIRPKKHIIVSQDYTATVV
jgi:hypothetical protein